MGFTNYISQWKQKILRPAVTSYMDNVGAAVAAEARRICPKRTGYLASTIGYLVRQSDLTVQIYADASYAVHVEYGTSRMAAQPFLRPALMSVRGGNFNTEIRLTGAREGSAPPKAGGKAKVRMGHAR